MEELGAALGSEGDLRRREALLASLLAIADASAAAALAQHLRSEDAGLRNACIETLQAMPDAALSVLPGLLSDPDPDVRLLATEIARTQPAEAANALLARLLEAETHPNVCGAAVEVLAEVGTSGAVKALRITRARFASEAFLPMAIDTVLARIGPGR
ncbi:HEAT repeat domain-containing protein [Methylobacterium sp. E-065]|uniref:HEAT repeat domain-containing protein n=1 Tax=Methylobacterium sp. E-065 TaxID=2836583 RepID=UPI001FB90A4F|nr:HEAT repeat domain-containing protein [Methylobacterium sp. E-065]MCJ2016435.1 HEAT repeat domain-containing protein [Methylobacterium sp. E-065]